MRVCDRAIYVGDTEDIVSDRFGPGLPKIRDWTVQHYDFAGYVTGADREGIRKQLGYRADEKVCIVTVGGSGVGAHLLKRVIQSSPRPSAEFRSFAWSWRGTSNRSRFVAEAARARGSQLRS